MPLGAQLRSDRPGSVRIGAEIWVLDAGQPGLFPLEAKRRDAHGPNLELLRNTISGMSRGQPWAVIGLPAPVFIVDTDSRHLLQFPPLHEAGGVVLQRWASDTGAERFCAATREQIEVMATSMVVDMMTLWKRRQEIAEQVDAVRYLANHKIPEDVLGVGVRAVAVDLELQRTDEHLSFYIEYDGVDEALRPGIVLDYIPANISGWSMYNRVPYGISGRHADRDTLRALGADGEIKAFAVAVLRAAPEGQAAVLARLAQSYETSVSFMTEAGPLYATLFWREGCIEAEVSIPGAFDQFGDWLELRGDKECSDETAVALVGSPLAAIGTLPFHVEAVITEAHPLIGGGLKLHLRTERRLIDCRTGRIWMR